MILKERTRHCRERYRSKRHVPTSAYYSISPRFRKSSPLTMSFTLLRPFVRQLASCKRRSFFTSAARNAHSNFARATRVTPLLCGAGLLAAAFALQPKVHSDSQSQGQGQEPPKTVETTSRSLITVFHVPTLIFRVQPTPRLGFSSLTPSKCLLKSSYLNSLFWE